MVDSGTPRAYPPSMTAIANLSRFDATGDDLGIVTSLAMQVEACMLMDDAAQARYAAIYGTPWVSLSDLQEMTDAAADAIIANDGPITVVR